MYRAYKPRHSIVQFNAFFNYDYETLTPDHPDYIPPDKFQTNDNKRLVPSVWSVDTAFKSTYPASGFEIPTHPDYARRYKFTKLGENFPTIQLLAEFDDIEYTQVGDGIESPITYTATRQVVNVYAELQTYQWYEMNQSHRNLTIVGAVPVTGLTYTLLLEDDQYYYHYETTHYWGFFSVSFSAVHDTSESNSLAPVPPQKIKIGSYINTSAFNIGDAEGNIPTTGGWFTESWQTGVYNGSFALISGGYPKFKE